MQAEQQSGHLQFKEWANDKGYDTAHTYDTERSRWVFFNPMTADLWEAWRAALSRPSTPQGWKQVPVELTDEMRDAADKANDEGENFHGIYEAMLSAAPPPPEQGGKG